MYLQKCIKMFFPVIILAVLQISAAAGENDIKKFPGTEITVGVMNGSAIGGPAIAHAKTWEERTGGKVRLLQFPFGDLFSSFMNSFLSEKPVFDVILYAPAWGGDFFPYLAELPEELAEDESFDDIHNAYRDRLMQWDEELIAVTLDGDLFFGYFRKDLFEDEKNINEFKAKYGYDLAAPDTWKQYRDIAEFFNNRKGPDGKTLAGTVEVFSMGNQQFWNLFSRASAYTNHPDNKGSQFFNPETMKAQVNNPGWIRAVEEYVDIRQFCPPDSMTYTLEEMRKMFAGGKAAMTVEWGDTGQISADKKQSSIRGNVGYFILPGTHDVWNYKTQKWDHMKNVHKAPFLAFGGWVGSVAKSSAKKDAAWDYIMWYGSPANSLHDVVTSGTGINPYRLSHFTNIDAWTKAFPRKAASEYLGVIRSSLDSPYTALDLRIPGFHEYTKSLEIQLTKALKKEITARQAMDNVAGEWEKITDKYDRKKQLSVYRSSMGLPPL